MLVEFRVLTGERFRLNLLANASIKQIKQFLVNKNYLQPGVIKIIFRAHYLHDLATISSLNLKPSDFLLCISRPVKEIPPVSQENQEANQQNANDSPQAGQEQQQNQNQNDPESEESRRTLADLGFTREEAYIALRLSQGDVQRAAELLVYHRNQRNGNLNNIPAPDIPQTVFQLPQQQNPLRNIVGVEQAIRQNNRDDVDSIEINSESDYYYSDYEDDESNFLGSGKNIPIVEEIKKHPEKLVAIIQTVDSMDHDFATTIRSNPEAFLTKIGADPRRYQCEEIRFISPEFRFLPSGIRRSMRNILMMNKDGLFNIVEMLAETNPSEFENPVRTNPEGFIIALGLDPSEYDCDKIRIGKQPSLQEISKNLTQEELAEVKYLNNLGIGINYILNRLQYYNHNVKLLHNELTAFKK